MSVRINRFFCNGKLFNTESGSIFAGSKLVIENQETVTEFVCDFCNEEVKDDWHYCIKHFSSFQTTKINTFRAHHSCLLMLSAEEDK